MLAAGCLCAGAAAFASVSGICPDGSMFIVQRPESVPCRDAKAVDPMDVPPMKPEYLPRPYGWEVFHRRNDPNNPYNLIPEPPPAPIEQGQEDWNAPQPSGEASVTETRVPERTAFQSGSTPLAPAAKPADQPGLELADREIEDLAMIVELSQRRAPVSFEEDAQGRLQLARSLAFESRMREHLAGRGQTSPGPVVLFAEDADAEGAFYENLTFVQDGMAFHPSSDNPFELGVIRGRLGALASGADVLGYVILPERLDPARPVDIYWNDRQLTATFQP